MPNPALNPRSAPAAPALATRLGALALLPFVLGAALVWIVRADVQVHVAAALSAYAATVVAFLGGVHWGFGFAVARPVASLFGWGVVPALAACVAVVMPPHAGLVLHGVLLSACYLVDRKVYPAQGAAAWLTLRFRLSVVAVISCWVAAAGTRVPWT